MTPTQIQTNACVCEGNWRSLINEYQQYFGHVYRGNQDGKFFIFTGILWGDDDFYYHMTEVKTGKTALLSCVGHLGDRGWGFERLDHFDPRD